jgi:hypothetical protein
MNMEPQITITTPPLGFVAPGVERIAVIPGRLDSSAQMPINPADYLPDGFIRQDVHFEDKPASRWFAYPTLRAVRSGAPLDDETLEVIEVTEAEADELTAKWNAESATERAERWARIDAEDAERERLELEKVRATRVAFFSELAAKVGMEADDLIKQMADAL